ncbi:MAG: tetratricopeptide repeat protein [Caulobacteraceae bacterium]
MTAGAPLTAVAPAEPTGDSLKLAAEHEAAGRLDEADACLDRLLTANPGDAEATHFKGVVAIRKGLTAEGAALMERSLTLGPAKPYYLRNLCEVYRTLGRYDEALEAGRRAAAGDPADPICQANLSVLHYERGESAEAVICAERALAINNNLPGAHFGLAEALLLRGELARGWEEYEWRFRMPGVPSLMPKKDIPQWDGKPLKDGRLMLIADQGFGDGIQFCRYIPWAAERCGELVVACSQELQPLIGQLPGIASMFDRWEAAPAAAAFLPLSGLPRLHGTRLNTVPADIPYLRADPGKAAAWKARLDMLAAPGHRRVGLVWAGRPTHKNDRNRSVALAGLGALTDLAGVTFVSLQKGPPQAQVSGYFGRAPLINLGPEIDDFADSMAIIEGLDLVVTVDTAIGHLAGAMGRPVFIMLPFTSDWRWLEGRPDTPWYPTARLFRPPAPRDWDAVSAEVAAALAEAFDKGRGEADDGMAERNA